MKNENNNNNSNNDRQEVSIPITLNQPYANSDSSSSSIPFDYVIFFNYPSSDRVSATILDKVNCCKGSKISPEQPNQDDNSNSNSNSKPDTEDEKVAELRKKRNRIVNRLKRVGLIVQIKVSTDDEQDRYILIGATEERLEEVAEQVELNLSIKVLLPYYHITSISIIIIMYYHITFLLSLQSEYQYIFHFPFTYIYLSI